MCASCGCNKLDDDHGDDRHLTMSDLRDAATAAGISLEQVAEHLQDAVQQAGERDSASSVDRRRKAS
jgi:hypothetical protein